MTLKIIIIVFTTLMISGASIASNAAARAETDIYTGFAPSGNAEDLILKCIDESSHEIRMMAYFFTSNRIAWALINAKHRGVNVQLVVDLQASQLKQNRQVLKTMKKFGISIRTNNRNHILHDKVMIVDRNLVQTGSYNYTPSSKNSNSENVIVVKGAKSVVMAYMEHWAKLWAPATRY